MSEAFNKITLNLNFPQIKLELLCFYNYVYKVILISIEKGQKFLD